MPSVSTEDTPVLLPTDKDSKRLAKRSTTRRPTGLASANVASGLAMADSASSLSTAQAQIGSPSAVNGPGSFKSLDCSAAAPNDVATRIGNGGGNGELPVLPVADGNFNEDDRESDNAGLEVEEEDTPVTGFAVASHNRNADFHELFPTVPAGDYLIEDYGCALQREILVQGRIYISENHICFRANIFGWITDLSIPIYEITSLEKKMTALFIPNAIQITTRRAKYTFASFLSRDTTFDIICNVWRLARPEDGGNVVLSEPASVDGFLIAASIVAGAVAVAGPMKVTQCLCGKESKHYPETTMEAVFPGTPEKIHNLMFASGFFKDFMVGNQKLLDIEMSDWVPVSPNSKLLTRDMTYTKPLSNPLGPRQTKCDNKDEMVHNDFDQYITTVRTTRTPDVPSGGVFAVKTRTCIMWASAMSSKVIVTAQVEWTGRSFFKGIIEPSAIAGTKEFHNELETAMRLYIQEHKSEFLPEGMDMATIGAIPEVTAPSSAAEGVAAPLEGEKESMKEALKRREAKRNAHGMQWAYDTFDGAFQVGMRSAKGALELINDAWKQSTGTRILWFVIVILVLSNLWTLGSSHGSSSHSSHVKRKILNHRQDSAL